MVSNHDLHVNEASNPMFNTSILHLIAFVSRPRGCIITLLPHAALLPVTVGIFTHRRSCRLGLA